MSKKEFSKANTRPTPPPFSIRFSWHQRDDLDQLTNGGSWGRYIKDVIFVQKRRPTGGEIQDRKQIGQLLGALGRSRLSSNINQLAKAVNSGSLPVNDEVERALLEACRTIAWMRCALIRALGLKPHSADGPEDERDDPER